MMLVPPKYLTLEPPEDIDSNKRKNAESSRMTLEDWIIEGGIGRLSYAILAAQSCEEDINEMHRSERQKIVNKYAGGEE